MILLTKSALGMTMQNCPDEMRKLADLLEKNGICVAAEFMDAVEREESGNVNELLEKAINCLTGKDSPIYGLRMYCEKFDIPVPADMWHEKPLLLLINDNASKIDERLKSAGV